MKLSETRQSAANNNEAKAMYAVHAIDPERAAEYADRMYRRRVEGWGDEERALEEVSRWCGMSPRSFKRLMKGQFKDPTLRMFGRVRSAYLDYCLRLINELKHEVQTDEEIYGHAAVGDIIADVEALQAKALAAKAIAIGISTKGKR
jgi:AraC-like DNA-binding protein